MDFSVIHKDLENPSFAEYHSKVTSLKVDVYSYQRNPSQADFQTTKTTQQRIHMFARWQSSFSNYLNVRKRRTTAGVFCSPTTVEQGMPCRIPS